MNSFPPAHSDVRICWSMTNSAYSHLISN